ncbi:MAG: preprotein translocase subunit SecE [Eubacteriales bacterium]|nr:preprotein translocase subunit SecE [Eubacteriales bacterium]
MAKNEQKDKAKNKKDKPSFGQRIRSWFKGIRAELKKVTWPEKLKFRKNVAAVLVIIIVSVVVIYFFDTLVTAFLNVTGFYEIKPNEAPLAVQPAIETSIAEEAPPEEQEAEPETKENEEEKAAEAEKVEATAEETTGDK